MAQLQAVWKGKGDGADSKSAAEAVSTNSKKRRKQPASLHGRPSDGGCDSGAAVDPDAAFDILSLLSALHEPAEAIRNVHSPRAPIEPLDKDHGHSAEWLLLDVIDSLEHPSSNTSAASTACAKGSAQPPSDRATNRSPSSASQEVAETAAAALGPDEGIRGGSGHASACPRVCSESWCGDDFREDLNSRHTARDSGCPMNECFSGSDCGSTTHGSTALGGSDPTGASSVLRNPIGTCTCACHVIMKRQEGNVIFDEGVVSPEQQTGLLHLSIHYRIAKQSTLLHARDVYAAVYLQTAERRLFQTQGHMGVWQVATQGQGTVASESHGVERATMCASVWNSQRVPPRTY